MQAINHNQEMKLKRGAILLKSGVMETSGYTDPNAFIDDFYESQLEGMRMRKATGFTGYATDGAVNPIYGARMLTQMYKTDNAFVAIGTGVYDHEGVRITQQKGMNSGNIGTSRDGAIPASVRPIIDMIREPYKELPYPFEYGLGLEALQGYDDTIEFKNYVDIMGADYGDNLDKALLRPTEQLLPLVDGEETSLQNLGSIIGAYSEVGKTYNGVTITGAMVSPYGGTAGDLAQFRTNGASTYDSTVIDGLGGVISNKNFKDGYYKARRYWTTGNSTTNKLWIATSVAQQILDNERDDNNNRVVTGMSDVYITWDINGVSTIPGLDIGGISARAMYGIPIIQDDNGITDRTSGIPNDSLVGEQFLVDSDVVGYDMLTPITLRSTDAYELTGVLRRKNVIMSRGEIRAKRFSGHAKLVNFATTAPASP